MLFLSKKNLKLICRHLLGGSNDPIGFHGYEQEGMAWGNECEQKLSKTRTDEEQDQWSLDCDYKIVCAICWDNIKESNQIIKKNNEFSRIRTKIYYSVP